MYKKILVPIDGSEHSLEVLKTAEEFAKLSNAQLYVITVSPNTHLLEPYPTTIPMKDLKEASENRSKFILGNAEEALTNVEGVHYDSLFGAPAKAIVEYAEENDMDLILIGNRGLGAFSRTLLGSVSARVINLSKCPVLVIKNSHEEE
ncbi:universal stress protein [Peptoniphilus sp. KCTC 25270]|uniref:universal stress protein n=1 Tax=Peptoniphilus sp. KCTC 25270 TaxID=2897414 RepID=UPI001E620E75|nr:universal stress protein [Peptoniphilus sp. KCTC 25270]MCD1146730.1 universal stress protein [Peptoniphilus sp. KCTC 25270]